MYHIKHQNNLEPSWETLATYYTPSIHLNNHIRRHILIKKIYNGMGIFNWLFLSALRLAAGGAL